MQNSGNVVINFDCTTLDQDKSVKHFHGSNYRNVRRGISENILEGRTGTGLESENKPGLS